MIELGLGRISRLLQQTRLPWKAIHIAGTNGKGSISCYLSHLLSTGGIRCGRFNSPHLIDRWDCVTIDDNVVQESLFRLIEDKVRARDRKLGIGASEFELLTATAFEIFNHEQVEVGVVEVGVGGRLDATNVLSNVLVSIISKIGIDHQSLLGKTIQDITREKAGILKHGVPCVVDGTNSSEALQTLDSRISDLNLEAVVVSPDQMVKVYPQLFDIFQELSLETHQQTNICCAVAALHLTIRKLRPSIELESLLPRLRDVNWPGRLQNITLESLVARKEPVLLDGAHNIQSAEVLRKHVDRKLRLTQGSAVTWVVAASRGKDLSELFHSIIRPGDNVATTIFGSVDGMPWVKATASAELARCVQTVEGIGAVKDFEEDIVGAINWACAVANRGPLVIAGSLYLVSDVLRLLRDAQGGYSTRR